MKPLSYLYLLLFLTLTQDCYSMERALGKRPHPSDQPADRQIGIACAVCNAPFKYRYRCFEHQIAKHLGLTFTCPIEGCPVTIKYRESLAKHMRRLHPEIEYNGAFMKLRRHVASSPESAELDNIPLEQIKITLYKNWMTRIVDQSSNTRNRYNNPDPAPIHVYAANNDDQNNEVDQPDSADQVKNDILALNKKQKPMSLQFMLNNNNN